MLALVDFDNYWIRWRLGRAAAVGDFADLLLDAIAQATSEVLLDEEHLDVRLYAGWVLADGQFSRAYEELSSAVACMRGRRRGMIVRPTLALAPIADSSAVFRGTVRKRSGQLTQKIVDGHIVSDVIFASIEQLDRSVAVVSDDDDLVPGVVVASKYERARIVLMRARSSGAGINDRLVELSGAKISQISI